MDVLLFLILITVLIVVVGIKNSVSSKFLDLQQRIDVLSNELKRYTSNQLTSKVDTPKIPVVEKEAPVKTDFSKPVVQAVREIPAPIPEKKEPTPVPVEKQEPERITASFVIEPPKEKMPPRPTVATPPKPGFFERNPDLEKFIGENLANKIGIAILVLGIGFFVKFAIDQNWINEIGRVFIGIVCGGILLGFAHRMRKNFAAFSSVLIGGGIAILYLTIAIAFHEYQIFSQVVAFVLMLIITAFTIVLALSYNRIELAVLAILGGFGSPFMVSTGEGNYVVLFTYILILDAGMLVLAYFKKWNLINIIAYAFTLLLFGSWLSMRFDADDPSVIWGALIFATLFFMVFFAMNIVNNLKQKTSFKAIEISILLSNTFLYYSAGMFILNNPYGENFQGLFTVLVGAFNFAFAYGLYKNTSADRNLVFLLIGLVLTFISLAAPVQLEGNYITLFWAAEAVLLLWLSQKSGIKLMKLGALLIMGLMVVSLLMDWDQIYNGTDAIGIVLNKGYITSIFAMVSIVITIVLLKNEKGEYSEAAKLYSTVLTIAGVVLLYTSQLLELRYQVEIFIDDFSTQEIIVGVYNMCFMLGLMLFNGRLNLPVQLKQSFAAWGIVGILSYYFVYHNEVIAVRNQYLNGESSLGFLFHYLLIVLLITLAILSLKRIRELKDFNDRTYNAYGWFFVFFFVFIASAELDHTVLLVSGATITSADHMLAQNHKIGYPILWGLASFLLIAVGLKWKLKHLRIISLTLMMITLLKLFLIDIKGISEGGKIAAFISLGILLLIVSFMYQRLKKLLLADEVPADKNIPE